MLSILLQRSERLRLINRFRDGSENQNKMNTYNKVDQYFLTELLKKYFPITTTQHFQPKLQAPKQVRDKVY